MESVAREGLSLEKARALAAGVELSLEPPRGEYGSRGKLLDSLCRLGAANAVLAGSPEAADRLLANIASVRAHRLLSAAGRAGLITRADLNVAAVFGWPSLGIAKELAESAKPIGTLIGQWETLIDPYDQGVAEKWFDLSVKSSLTEEQTKNAFGSWAWVRAKIGVPAIPEGKKVYLQIGSRHGSNPCERLWINQREVPVRERYLGGGWGALTLVDVSDFVKRGQANDFAMTYVLANIPEMKLVTLPKQ